MNPREVRVLVVESSPHGAGTAKVLAQDDRLVTFSVRDQADVDAAVHTFHPDAVIVVATIDDRETSQTLQAVIRTHNLPTVLVAASKRQMECLSPLALAHGAAGVETMDRLVARSPEGDSSRSRLRLLARANSVTVRAATPVQRSAQGTTPVVGIVASTGGPDTLAAILSHLPRPFPLPIAVVQHLAAGFAPTFVKWLADASRCEVCLPSQGESLRPGVVYVAPDASHLRVSRDARAVLDRTTKDASGLCPSGNVLLRSLADELGAHAVGVVLTGMGVDGGDGLSAIERAGGVTIVQDKTTSIVDGMPGRARALCATARVLPSTGVAQALGAIAAKLASRPSTAGFK